MRKGHPDVHASGDDGDENAKAALYALKELDGSKPTVAVFITDAGYHRTKSESHTAQAEDDYLLEKGAHVTDFYVLFDSVRGEGLSSLLSETLQRYTPKSNVWYLRVSYLAGVRTVCTLTFNPKAPYSSGLSGRWLFLG